MPLKKSSLRFGTAVACLLTALTASAAGLEAANSAAAESSYVLWYRQPASEWVEALPVGNGRLGGMVFGGVAREQIQLNEETLWTGGRAYPAPAGAYKSFPEIRKLLFDGKYAEAESLVKKKMLVGRGEGNSYQTMGNLFLTADLQGEPSHYRRSLDLDTGVATTTFEVNGVTYRREVFSSAPDQVLAVRLTTEPPTKITIRAMLDRTNTPVRASGDDTLILSNDSAKHVDGVKFATVLKAVAAGGRTSAAGNQISIRDATRVVFLLSAASDYNRTRPLEPLKSDFRARALEQAQAASRRVFPTADDLKERSVADHQKLFRRVDLKLSPAPAPDKPTDERLDAVKQGADDPGLAALYFQYGRYLLISSSRPGDMPANLQGIWNKDLYAPWGADYHININIQMNYWPAEVCNLSECHEPFFDFVEAYAATSGRQTAKDFYNARGFVGHYTTDAWLYTPTGGSPQWALWQMGGAWCSRDFMEHYWFTGDRDFLKNRAYPILRDASLFLLDWLVPNPTTGKLVSGPSASPENQFIGPDGTNHSVSMGDSMDQEIAWDTFNNLLAAARELGIEDKTTARVKAALEKLAMPGIAPDGRLMEWAENFKEAEPGHRHISHLFGLHPGYEFTQNKTPDYMAAARKTIDYRLANGGGHTGWSRAWIINFWARFRDADKAYENFQALLQKSTLKNLFDTHPPFQIDGNFGGTAGIAEMLIQSHDGEIVLLPALPKQWGTGEFRGLRARRGFEVSVAWKDGKVETAEIKSLLGAPCRVRSGGKLKEFQTEAGKIYILNGENLD
jgi:alpha-L-fucosidase 2